MKETYRLFQIRLKLLECDDEGYTDIRLEVRLFVVTVGATAALLNETLLDISARILQLTGGTDSRMEAMYWLFQILCL